MHQVLRREDIIQLSLCQQSTLKDDFAHALTGFGTNLPDDVTVMVADERVQVSDDTDGVVDEAFAHGFVRRDAVNAFFQQVVAGIGQNVDGFKHRLANHWLHDVQLQLTRFGSHGHGNVVADDFEAHLVNHFWHHRVHFSWHDGRTGLQFWQVDFVQASAWTGGEQAQVVTDFGEFHCQTF
ncbi:hypothetical protein D3C72_1506240 [compost metagenome]